MDLRDTPDEAAFRAHVRSVLEEHAGELLHVAPGQETPDAREHEADLRRTQQVLAEAGVDVLACETVPATAEAEALVAEAQSLGVPIWLSLTTVVDDDGVVRTRRGEPAADVFAMAAGVDEVIAVADEDGELEVVGAAELHLERPVAARPPDAAGPPSQAVTRPPAPSTIGISATMSVARTYLP